MDSRSKRITGPVDLDFRTVGRREMGRQDSGNPERNTSKQGQSGSELDNLGCDSQPLINKSEGQLLEDTKVGRSMLSSIINPPRRNTTLVSPNDDDPLVYLKAAELIRHQGPSRSSSVSKVNSEDHLEFKRPYFGPSHVDDGGGAELRMLQFHDSNFCRIQSKVPQVELPTELRKKVLRERIKCAERQLVTDPKLHAHAWRIKNFFGEKRDSALRNFWREVYKEENHDPRRVFKEFALNDYLEASDELHGLENPMRSWWRPNWKDRHRSSAVTAGLGSLSLSMVGTGLASGTGLRGTCVAGSNPLQTSDALSLRGGYEAQLSPVG
jgi:hypothetical protein